MKRQAMTVGIAVLLGIVITASIPAQQAATGRRTPTKKISQEADSRALEKLSESHQKLEPAALRQPNSQVQLPGNIQQSAAAYEIPWHSMNAGGAPVSDPQYSVNGSLGQSMIGFSANASNEGSTGYWYGVCSCPFQCDYDEDTFLTSLDLSALIDVLFAGRPEDQDASCVTSRGDFDCDGFPTSLDLSGLIDHLFAGGPGPCDPCAE